MTRQKSENRHVSKGVWIALLATAAVAAVINVGHASQRTEQSRRAFEVTSIKRSVSNNRGGLTQTLPGRFVATNATVKMLFRPAYGVRDYQITGGPSWIDTERYDIQATTGFAAATEDVHEMLQKLLAEQFKVRVHHESKEIAVYALVLGKNDLKLKEVPESGDAVNGKGGKPNGVTMPGLAQYLSRLPNVDRPVLDRTGLTGRYDVTPLLTGARSKGDNSNDSVFTVVQDFGLKLESQKGTVDMLVIDHVERPPEN